MELNFVKNVKFSYFLEFHQIISVMLKNRINTTPNLRLNDLKLKIKLKKWKNLLKS